MPDDYDPFVVSLLTYVSKSWLDERLFGWSRSANRGTSAWDGSSSHDASRVATPDASESEDDGDYEHVLGYLPSEGGDASPSRLRSRSLRSSYADLQQLKQMSSSGVIAASGREDDHASQIENSGLHMRHGHRERRLSLNDGVSVGRIGALDRDETFKEATEDINLENSIRKHEDDMK